MPLPRLRDLLACGLTLLALVSSPAAAAPDPPFDVKVLIINSFDPERRVWLDRKLMTRTFTIEGIDQTVLCTDEGVCVLTTGMGKVNAAASVSALLADPPFDLSRTIFLAAGLAGSPPEIGTIGSVAWASYILDFDLIYHLVYHEDGTQGPFVERAVEAVGTELFTLNKQIVRLAYRVTKGTKLVDNERARAYRLLYPGQAGRVPSVLQCDTVTSDTYWHGRRISVLVSRLMKQRTNGAGAYCTTQMEASGTASAMERFGYLNRYLSLRVMGNFDQPYPGQSVPESLRQLHREVAIENLYRVGDSFVKYVLAHREEVLAQARIRQPPAGR